MSGLSPAQPTLPSTQGQPVLQKQKVMEPVVRSRQQAVKQVPLEGNKACIWLVSLMPVEGSQKWTE